MSLQISQQVGINVYCYRSRQQTQPLKGALSHAQKLVAVYKPTLCLFNALGLAFQRFLESGV